MTHIITQTINSTEDVIQFFQELNKNGIEIDVDASFLSYKNEEKPIFAEQEAERLDKLMDKCFDVCHKEQKYSIYGLATEIFNQ